MKVVYNACYGGFSLSPKAVMRYAELKGFPLYAFVDKRDEYGRLMLGHMQPAAPVDLEEAFCIHYCTSPTYDGEKYFSPRNIPRDDPTLVQVVEELGKEAGGRHAALVIEDVPAGTLYRIDEYDGMESIRSQDSYEWKIAT